MAIFFKKKKTTKSKELLRDESKHIKCEFLNNPDACMYDCDTCAISIKASGDDALKYRDYDIAIKAYKIAVEKEPKFAEAWCCLGNAYGMKSEYSNALYAFNKAVEQDGTYGKALLGKAITLRNMSKYHESLECLDAVLALYDNDDSKRIKAGIEDYLIKNSESDPTKLASDYFKPLMKELTEIAITEGYLAEYLPFIPELSSLIYPFTIKCYEETAKILEAGSNALRRCGALSFYGGMGATMLWNTNWPELENKGIYDSLTCVRGFDELDEYVLDLVGIESESDEDIDLENLVIEACDKIIYNYTKMFEKAENDDSKIIFILQALRAMFLIGVGVEMNRLGMK